MVAGGGAAGAVCRSVVELGPRTLFSVVNERTVRLRLVRALAGNGLVLAPLGDPPALPAGCPAPMGRGRRPWRGGDAPAGASAVRSQPGLAPVQLAHRSAGGRPLSLRLSSDRRLALGAALCLPHRLCPDCRP